MYLKLEDQHVNQLVEILMEQIETVSSMYKYCLSDLETERKANEDAQQKIEALEAEIKPLHEECKELRHAQECLKDACNTCFYNQSKLTNSPQH